MSEDKFSVEDAEVIGESGSGRALLVRIEDIYPEPVCIPKSVIHEQKIDESTQAVVVARLKALPSESVAAFWRCWMVARVRDFTGETMPAVNQVLKNLEKEVGIG